MFVGEKKDLRKNSFSIGEINWLGNKKFMNSTKKFWELRIKIRSSQPLKKALIFPISETQAKVEFKENNDEALSPGQACVFYSLNNDRVFGGGWIKKKDF